MAYLPLDRVDAKLNHVLTVAVRPLRVILAALLLEDNDFRASRFPNDGRRDRGTVDRG
jgi:hypothetical protein